MSGSNGSHPTQTTADGQGNVHLVREEIAPGALSQSLSEALEQADTATRHARAALSTVQDVMQRLRIMEDRLRAMAAASSSFNWLANGDGLMGDAPHWRLFTGQTSEQARDWGWLDAIHPEDYARSLAAWRVALQQRLPYTDEFRVRRADGAYRDVLTQAAPIYEDDGAVREWVGVCIDISRRKQLERGLADNIAQLEATFEAMGDAVFVYDESGQPVRANRAAHDFYGGDPDDEYLSLPREERRKRIPAFDMEGRPLPQEHRPAARALRGEVFRGNDAQDVRLQTADGRMRDMNFTGAPIWRDNRIAGAVVVARDVTERRRLERVAREAEREAAARARELEAALEAMVDGVAIYDAEGRLLRVNRAAVQFLALPESERGMASALITPEATTDTVRADVALIHRLLSECDAHDDVGVCHEELRFVGLDGRERELSMTGVPIRDDDGTVTGAVIVAHDVTERNQLERQRGEMLQMVAHDLANPLMAAKVYVRQRRNAQVTTAAADGREAQAFGALEHALGRIDHLVKDLQLAVRIELGRLNLSRAPVDLVALAQAEVNLISTATGRTVHLDITHAPLLADVDASRIGQSLTNLLGNAHKYSPLDRPISLRLTVERDKALLAVADEGPGIPSAEVERIWEQFHQVKAIQPMAGEGGGLGLGLYITRSLVEAHGGEVGVTSAVGQGSTFWFTLPLLAGEG